MVKALELTDFYGREKKEYVIVSRITHWFFYDAEVLRPVTISKTVKRSLFGSHTIEETTEKKLEGIRTGSAVHLDDGTLTYVAESPEQILEMLKNDQTIALGV